MKNKQLVESGKIIAKHEREIDELKRTIMRLKKEQSEEGIAEIKNNLGYCQDFIKDLRELFERYFPPQ